MKDLTPTQILGEIVTKYTFDQDEVDEVKEDDKKKSIAFKASSTKGKKNKEESSNDEEDSSSSIDNGEMTIFVHRFGKFMKKKGFGGSRRRSSSKRKEERRCYDCGEVGHLVAD